MLVEVRDFASGRTYRESYDKLVLCLGAEPVRPPIPGADDERVDVLRDIADMDWITAALATTARARAQWSREPRGVLRRSSTADQLWTASRVARPGASLRIPPTDLHRVAMSWPGDRPLAPPTNTRIPRRQPSPRRTSRTETCARDDDGERGGERVGVGVVRGRRRPRPRRPARAPAALSRGWGGRGERRSSRRRSRRVPPGLPVAASDGRWVGAPVSFMSVQWLTIVVGAGGHAGRSGQRRHAGRSWD